MWSGKMWDFMHSSVGFSSKLESRLQRPLAAQLEIVIVVFLLRCHDLHQTCTFDTAKIYNMCSFILTGFSLYVGEYL